jgi:copper transport protein
MSLSHLVNAGIVLLLIAEPVALLGQTASLGAGQMLDPATVSAALDSSFGRALGERIAVPLLLWLLVGIARGGMPAAWWLTLVLGGGGALLDGGSAHAGSVRPPALGFLVNAFHVGAMGVWVGGLAALVAIWPRLAKSLSSDARQAVVLDFSRVAAVAVGTIALTGAALAALHGVGPADLLATPYALVAASKLIAFLGVGVVAWRGMRAPDPQARRWWLGELAGVAGLLALAGLIASLPPPG